MSDISEVLDDLSALDRAILRGAGSGLSSKQIARVVDRSSHTVDDRMKALKRRLGAADRARAGRMLIAFEAGLDPLKDWGGQSLALAPVAPTRPLSLREAATMTSTFDPGPTPEDIFPERPKAPVAPFEVAPLAQEEIDRIRALKQAFEARFPPMPLDRSNLLILSWAEIERQFLDLCAPWDQQEPCYEIRKAAQSSRHETPEQTIHWLFTLARAATDIDTPEPRWGSGDSIPMP